SVISRVFADKWAGCAAEAAGGLLLGIDGRTSLRAALAAAPAGFDGRVVRLGRRIDRGGAGGVQVCRT
ncbi:hypothetical protein PJN95_29110, partial [Mycobacterium kansasii]